MKIDQNILRCVDLIEEAKFISVLTGAGISTNAGIPDFRGPKGLYITKRYDPETVFDIRYFHRDPKPFYDFARDFVKMEETIKPTFTHYFLKELEDLGKLKGVITQNIDALHHKAGSKKVLEVHGSFWKSHCLKCRKEFSYEDMKKRIFREEVSKCSCAGVIKPDVVFFGENVKYLDEAFKLAEKSDLFFVLGTSCVVHPAAMIPTLCKGKIIIVNQGEVELDCANIVLSVESDSDKFFQEVSKYLKKQSAV